MLIEVSESKARKHISRQEKVPKFRITFSDNSASDHNCISSNVVCGSHMGLKDPSAKIATITTFFYSGEGGGEMQPGNKQDEGHCESLTLRVQVLESIIV